MADTKCPACGDEMELVESSFTPSTRPRPVNSEPGATEITTACMNPDCPAKDSDLAPAAEGQRQPRFDIPDKPTTPGSMGGDNGGG